MLENDYLELCDQLKDKFDEIQEKEQKLKGFKIHFMKVFCTIYGLVRVLDNIASQEDEINPQTILLIEILRGFCSDFFDESVNVII